MKAFVQNKGRAPFVWDMVRYCLDLPYSSIKHFPAGTYNEQVRDETGTIELRLMNITQSVWYAFEYLSMTEWGENERKLFKRWFMPVKQAVKPTRRLDSLVSLLWRPSWWLIRVMRSLRRD